MRVRGLRRKLVNKSIEAFVLALETINRLSIEYRVETFSYLICNAWELLLKAKIIESTGQIEEIYRKDKEHTTLSLRECLSRVIVSETDPVRRNVEKVAKLRDESTHFLISRVPTEAMELFQACVINYHRFLQDWFAIPLSDRFPVGMMALVYDQDPAAFNLGDARLRRKLGRETADFLMRFQNDLKQERKSLGNPQEFSVDIGYKLALVKNPSQADICLTSGLGGTPVRLVHVAKDTSETHPYRFMDVIQQTNKRINGTCSVNSHDINCVIKAYNIKKRPDFFYQGKVKGSPGQYSDQFIEWLIGEQRKDVDFFAKAKARSQTPKKATVSELPMKKGA